MIYVLGTFAAAAVVGLIGFVLYKCFRPKFPIKVECWFCSCATVVPYGNKNCWDCPNCEQYNGFREDGHYNKPVPAQYNESMNYPINCKADDFISKDSLLCDECNQNQLLKVRQLAAFVPLNENNYDTEVQAYERHLEHVYRLCVMCQGAVNSELDKQDSLLVTKLDRIQAELSRSSEKPAVEKVSYGTKMESFARSPGVSLSAGMATLSSICSLTLCVANFHVGQHLDTTHWLPTSYVTPLVQSTQAKEGIIGGAGLLTCLLAKWFVGKDRLLVLDAMHIPVWILTLLVGGEWGTLAFVQDWSPMAICAHHILNAAVSTLCLLVPRKARSQPNIVMKRISLDSSRSSQGSESTLTDRSPLQSVSEAAYGQRSSQPAGQFDKLDDTLTDLGAFSIGLPSLRRSGSGIFECTSFTTGHPVSTTGFSFGQTLQDRLHRPLISPAKLNFQAGCNGGRSFTSNRADNPFLQANRETTMFKGSDSHGSRPAKTFSGNFNLGQDDHSSEKFGGNFHLGQCDQTLGTFSDKASFFSGNRLIGSNTPVFSDGGSTFSGHFSTPMSKSHFDDRGSNVSGRLSSYSATQGKSWSVRNHAINKMEDFQDRDSKSTDSSLCPVDSTTRSEVKSQGSLWRSPAVLGFVLGASFVVNVFLMINSWQRA